MILITGALGYIGSHTIIELAKLNYEIIALDNLSNSKLSQLSILEKIVSKKITFFKGDIRDKNFLESLFKSHNISAVIHFAGLKAVGESVINPLKYFDNNIGGTINLLQVMNKNNCNKIVFSSSATVYGDLNIPPFKENSSLRSNNPYGLSKITLEKILEDLAASDSKWIFASLRYFNPIGAHSSGLIGDDPLGKPNNIMPFIVKVALKKIKTLEIFGNDYDTPDGTGIRDYIHVEDIAQGHIRALEYIEKYSSSITVNLGTGKGCSVLNLVKTFSNVNSVKVPYVFAPRRNGDIASSYADTSLATQILNWKPLHNIERMCLDTWKWARTHYNLKK